MVRTRRYVPVLLALAVGVGGGLLLAPGEDEAGPGPAPISLVDRESHAVSVIVFPIDQDSPAHLAKQHAWLAYDALVDGQDFAAVARARSKTPTSRDGGFFGFVPVHHDTAFAGAVQVLRPGEISLPLLAGGSWRIIKRHTFDEARRLERRWRIPVHGFFVPWKGLPGHMTGPTKQEAYEAAVEMRDRLAAGTITLEQAAERFAPRRNTVGVDAWIGHVAERDHNQAIWQALEGTRPGRLVGPVEAAEGWGVLVRGRHLRALFKHILIQHIHSRDRTPGVTRTREAARKLAEEVLAAVRDDRGSWNEWVERHSDDPGTRGREGAMGVLWPGALPPGFEDVVYDMEAGEIHDEPVETPYGYHVLWKVN